MDFITYLNGLTHDSSMFNLQSIHKLRQPESQNKWQSLRNLFLRPWWTRIWTIQEQMIPDDSCIRYYCGSKTMDEYSLGKALSIAYECDIVENRGKSWTHAWNRSRIRGLASQRQILPNEEHKPIITTAALAAYCSFAESRDPHDKLYGMLGLVTDSYLIPSPNYDRPVELVYIDFAKAFIKHNNSLDIICFSQLYSGYNDASSQFDFPSWVPDWRIRIEIPLVVPLLVSQSSNKNIGNFRPGVYEKPSAIYDASKGFKFSPSYESFQLITHGVILGQVDALSCHPFSTYNQSIEQATTSKFSKRRKFLAPYVAMKLLMDICACLMLGRRDRFMHEEIEIYKIVNQISGLYSSRLSRPYDEKGDLAGVQKWFQENLSFRVRGHEFRDIFERTIQYLQQCEDELFQPFLRQEKLVKKLMYTLSRMSRRLMVTDKGDIGMISENAKKGDLICVLAGCSVPVLLRRATDKSSYVFVGECYLEGYMNGEALDELESRGEDLQEIRII